MQFDIAPAKTGVSIRPGWGGVVVDIEHLAAVVAGFIFQADRPAQTGCRACGISSFCRCRVRGTLLN